MNFVRASVPFMRRCRELCTQHGAMLVFDEVMTGFRVALGSAQSLYAQAIPGFKPDITVPQISDPDYVLRMKYQTRESDLRGHLINELAIKDEAMESDKIADPRFQLTAAQLEQQGIKDFQLNYALDTLRRTTKSSVALRSAATRPAAKK